MPFQEPITNKLLRYAKRAYSTAPEYLWARLPDAAILRRPDNRKWYALVMKLERARMGLSGEGVVDVLNIKCDPDMGTMLRGMDGFYPAYHMNKTKWISVLLDRTVKKDMILDLLDASFALTAPKKTRGKSGDNRSLTEKNGKK